MIKVRGRLFSLSACYKKSISDRVFLRLESTRCRRIWIIRRVRRFFILMLQFLVSLRTEIYCTLKGWDTVGLGQIHSEDRTSTKAKKVREDPHRSDSIMSVKGRNASAVRDGTGETSVSKKRIREIDWRRGERLQLTQ